MTADRKEIGMNRIFKLFCVDELVMSRLGETTFHNLSLCESGTPC